jgi:hypothetical protein
MALHLDGPVVRQNRTLEDFQTPSSINLNDALLVGLAALSVVLLVLQLLEAIRRLWKWVAKLIYLYV